MTSEISLSIRNALSAKGGATQTGASAAVSLGSAPSLPDSSKSVQGEQVQETTNQVEQQKVDEAVSRLADHAQNLRRNLQFSVHEETGQTIVRVVDPETDELIRQIPAREVLALAESLDELSGALLKVEV